MEKNSNSNDNQEKNSFNSKELLDEKKKSSVIEEEKDKESFISKSIVSNSKEIINSSQDENVNDIISQFLKIKNCSVILYGIKPSPDKLKFGYCRTCDINLMNRICIECLYECHKKYDHDIREIKMRRKNA